MMTRMQSITAAATDGIVAKIAALKFAEQVIKLINKMHDKYY